MRSSGHFRSSCLRLRRQCAAGASLLITVSGLAACGHDTPAQPSQVVRDELVTSAVHPFVAQYGGHCAGLYYYPPRASLLRARAGTLYFQGTTDGVDAGLWATDGTTTGTRLLLSSADYRQFSATPFLSEILPTERGVFFVMDPGCVFPPPIVPTAPPPAPLWWTDGRGTASALLRDYQVQGLVQSGDRIFFRAKGADGRTGLWTLSLATQTPVEVWHFDNVSDIAPLGSQGVVFFARRSGEDTRIWFSDGTQDGSHGLGDFCPAPLMQLASVGPRAYFVCDRDLAVTDGTPNGTRPAIGAPSRPTDVFNGLVDFNGRLAFFFRPVAAENTVELWTTDATADTRQLASFSVPTDRQAGAASLVVADKLDFVVEDTLWRSDGTQAGTAAVAALPPAASAPDTTYGHRGGRFLAALDSRLLVVMNDAELWQVDGSVAKRVALDPSVTGIAGIAATPSRVYYSAEVSDPAVASLPLPALRAWRLADE